MGLAGLPEAGGQVRVSVPSGELAHASLLDCSVHVPKGRCLLRELVGVRHRGGLGKRSESSGEQKACPCQLGLPQQSGTEGAA